MGNVDDNDDDDNSAEHCMASSDPKSTDDLKLSIIPQTRGAIVAAVRSEAPAQRFLCKLRTLESIILDEDIKVVDLLKVLILRLPHAHL